jgi:hypothetical protein
MGTYKTYSDNYERGILGYATLSILGQSCLGSVAAMLVLMNGNSIPQMMQLFLVVISCMGFNGAVLSQQKPKLIFNFLVISAILCAVIAVGNLYVIYNR